jgi:DNA-directed RNA polymerase subunit RPC12/RpoP
MTGHSTIKIPTTRCTRCGHEWSPRVPSPVVCPMCRSRYWNQPKQPAKPTKQADGTGQGVPSTVIEQ